MINAPHPLHLTRRSFGAAPFRAVAQALSKFLLQSLDSFFSGIISKLIEFQPKFRIFKLRRSQRTPKEHCFLVFRLIGLAP